MMRPAGSQFHCSTGCEFTQGVDFTTAGEGNIFRLFGGGDSPASVTLTLAPGVGDGTVPLIRVGDEDAIVGHLRLLGENGNRPTHGVWAESSGEGNDAYIASRFSNLIIDNMSSHGILVEFVGTKGVSIQNNTIVNCPRGITVQSVSGGQAQQMGIRPRRYYFYSAVQNNIVAQGSVYGISIGDSSGSASEWNPLVGPGGGVEPGSPIVPVSHNLVYSSAGGGFAAYLGDSWYATDYGFPIRGHGELETNPQLTGWYRIGNPSIERLGNPLHVDRELIYATCEGGYHPFYAFGLARRTMGAMTPVRSIALDVCQ